MTTQATHLDASSPPPAPAIAVNHGERNMNPAGMGLVALLREDLRTHDGKIFEQGFWAVAVHRFGNWRMGLPKLLRVPATLLYRFAFKWVEWTCGITLPYTVGVGRRVRVWHHRGEVPPPRPDGGRRHPPPEQTVGL